jgi:hypothetical protein
MSEYHLEDDRKVMSFDLKGQLLTLVNVKPEIKGFMPYIAFCYASKNP